ncbi:ABC transporter permease [Paenibacillus sp. MMS20-IR301]|uniref:ABC transporter permease n=1 Tax=Paenibacillus sp. MMS20-IR301 TaxID=2895946 RepID=UPI0028EDFF7E|nr:ABC transporter permease [Paenibacillus sp. MMS20-IR301]WNS42732.1 ABC transporter permease [Paenibacillus sp. MMS20-IR301]
MMKNYWANFIKYRHLLRELVINDIKLKYRRSVLGIIWSVLQPLMMMVVLTLVFSNLFKSDIPYFPVYVLTGRIVWDLYYQGTASSMGSVVANASLIKKVYVPKYIFPLARCLSSLVNTGFSLVALLIVMLVVGVKITPVILLLPIPIFYVFLFATGVGLLLSAYNVFFRDISYLYEVFTTAWMYFTPLFYPPTVLPEKYQFIFTINPLYYMVDFFRQIVMYQSFPTVKDNIICLSIGIVSFIIGFYAFYKKQDKFILYV